MKMRNSVHIAVLDKTLPNPLLKESDEEKGTAVPAKDSDKDKKKDEGKEKDKAKGKEDTSSVKKTVIDIDGLADRILALPVPVGFYSSLASGPEKQFYYKENPAFRLQMVRPLQNFTVSTWKRARTMWFWMP